MLELRPNCEGCVDTVLGGVCPSCGSGLAPRPVRPAGRLLHDPPSTVRVLAAACGDRR